MQADGGERRQEAPQLPEVPKCAVLQQAVPEARLADAQAGVSGAEDVNEYTRHGQDASAEPCPAIVPGSGGEGHALREGW